MTRTLSSLVALTSLSALLLSTGCLGKLDSDLTGVLPDERIKINLPLESAAKGLDDGEEKEWAEFYLFTAEVTEDVNGFIVWVLGTVEGVTSTYPPSYVNEEESEATWGPYSKSLDPVETQIRVAHDLETDVYDWYIEQWPKEDASSIYAIVTGEVDPGATEDTSTGRFLVDFSTAAELDPTVDNVGTFDVDYEIREDGAGAAVSWTDFGAAGRDANYLYDQTNAGDGTMDLAMEGDVNDNGTMETLVIRSRWLPSGAGRSDVYVTGGDLGEERKTASECWGTSFEREYYTDTFTGGVGTTEGDAATCVFADTQYSTLSL